MSLEERASSWALSLVDLLESDAETRVRALAAAVATVVMIIMWIAHLTYPGIFTFFLEQDNWAKLFLGFVLAPPFVVAYTIGSFIYPERTDPSKTDEPGPMSAYFYQEKRSRSWRLLIVAAMIAAVNFMLMFVTSGV